MIDSGESNGSITDVLQIFNISTVICVDDVYVTIDMLGIEEIIGSVASGLATDETRVRIEALFREVEFGDTFDEAWRDHLRDLWSNANDADKEQWIVDLGEITGAVTEKDRIIASQLAGFLNGLSNVVFRAMTPREWLSASKEIVSKATADKRVLCLFDQDLQNAGYSARGGFEFIDAVVRDQPETGVPNVVCALLSHTIAKGDEEEEWRSMAREHLMSLSKALPISKQRLDSAEEFAGGIARAIINLGQERMKDSVERITMDARSLAIKELRNVSVWDFDQIVLKSSEKEGVWEANTLDRLYDLLERRVRYRYMLTGEERSELDDFVQTIRDAQAQMPPEKTIRDGSRVWELRHLELFLDKEINDLLLPIDLGDLFSNTRNFYVLLAQPCDLMLRGRDGQRRANVATLVPIGSEKRKKDGGSPFGESGPMFRPHCPYFQAQDDKKHWYFNFREAAEVSLDVLDLASFRTDGRCDFDSSLGTPQRLFASSKLRYKLIEEHFRGIGEIMDLGKQILENSTQSESTRTRIIEQMLSGYCVQKGILTPVYENGVFDFGLQRVGRYQNPAATDLLAKFESLRTRPAHAHDFADIDR